MQLDVDAERARHVGVLRRRADQQAEPRALEELPDRHGDDDAGGDEEEAIERERLVEQEDDAGQQRRGRHLQGVRTPDQPDGLADHEGQAEGHHQEGVGVAAIEPAQDREFERRAEQPDQHRRHGEGHPEVARPFAERVADEGAQHVERAMREVHDAHQAEDQGEPDAEEEQQRRLRQRVDDLGQQEGEGTHGLRIANAG